MRKANTKQQKEILAACRGAARKLMERSDMRGVRFHRSVEELRRDGMSPLVIAEMERIHGVRVQELRENAAGSRRRRAVGAGVARSAFARGVQAELLREAGLSEREMYPTMTLTEAIASGALDPGKMDFSYRSPGTTYASRSREPVPAGHERDRASNLHDNPGSFTDEGVTMRRSPKGRGGHPKATRPSSPPGDWEDPMRQYDDEKRWGKSGGPLDETEDGADPEGRKARLQRDEDEVYAAEDERMMGSEDEAKAEEDEDETREMHDPEAEESALRAADSALSDLVDAFGDDPADERYADQVNEWRSMIAGWLSDLGSEGYGADAGSEDEDGDPLVRADEDEDETEDEMRARGMHAEEPEDEDEIRPDSVGPHDDVYAADLKRPRMMQSGGRARARTMASAREAFRGSDLTKFVNDELYLNYRAGRSA